MPNAPLCYRPVRDVLHEGGLTVPGSLAVVPEMDAAAQGEILQSLEAETCGRMILRKLSAFCRGIDENLLKRLHR